MKMLISIFLLVVIEITSKVWNMFTSSIFDMIKASKPFVWNFAYTIIFAKYYAVGVEPYTTWRNINVISKIFGSRTLLPINIEIVAFSLKVEKCVYINMI